MQIVKDIYLDFYQGEMVVVTAKQGDVGRFLRVTLLDNGNAFQIPAGATATIARGKVRNTCTIDTDGTVLAPITADMEPGRRPAQIEISQGSDRLSSWNFILDVMFSARDDQAIEGSNEYSQLQQLVDQAEGLIEDVGNTEINFTPASTRQNLSVGDTIKQAFGKIYKWFADLGAAAFQAVANNCTTTAAGSVLDARQGKTLYDRIGELNQLATSAKGSVVDAINELNSKIIKVNTGTGTEIRYPIYSGLRFLGLISAMGASGINGPSPTIFVVEINYDATACKLTPIYKADNVILTAEISGEEVILTETHNSGAVGYIRALFFPIS